MNSTFLFCILPGRFFPAKVNGMAFQVGFEVGIVFDKFDNPALGTIVGILHTIGVFGEAGWVDIKNQRHMEAAITVTGGLGGHRKTPVCIQFMRICWRIARHWGQ